MRQRIFPHKKYTATEQKEKHPLVYAARNETKTRDE